MILDVDSIIAPDIALKKRLHVSGWALSETLKSIRKTLRVELQRLQ